MAQRSSFRPSFVIGLLLSVSPQVWTLEEPPAYLTSFLGWENRVISPKADNTTMERIRPILGARTPWVHSVSRTPPLIPRARSCSALPASGQWLPPYVSIRLRQYCRLRKVRVLQQFYLIHQPSFQILELGPDAIHGLDHNILLRSECRG